MKYALLSLLILGFFFFSSQGPLVVGTAVNAGSASVLWTNPSNATACDDVFATAVIAANSTYFLRGTNAGFTIPGGSTIDGVTVGVKRKDAVGAASLNITVYLIVGGTEVGAAKTPSETWSTTNTLVNYGNSSDLWGATPTAAQVNASDFGSEISVFGTESLSVDCIQLTVNYTAPTFNHTQDGFWMSCCAMSGAQTRTLVLR